MIRAALLLSLLWAAPASPPDAPTWSDCAVADAQRMVTVEVVDGSRVTSLWRFPVKLWAPTELAQRPSVVPVKRWFPAAHMTGTKKNEMVFSQTSLSGVEEDKAFVSFEWFPSDKVGEKTLAKHVLMAPLGETAVLSVESGVKVRVRYERSEKRE